MELEEIAVVEAVAEQTAAMEAVEIERKPAEERREVGLDGGIGLGSCVERGRRGRGGGKRAEGGAREEREEPGPARRRVGEWRRSEMKIGRERRGKGGMRRRGVERIDDRGEIALRQGASVGVERRIGRGRGERRRRRTEQRGRWRRRRRRAERRRIQRTSRWLGVVATIEGKDLTEQIVDAVFHIVGHRRRRVELERTRETSEQRCCRRPSR